MEIWTKRALILIGILLLLIIGVYLLNLVRSSG